MTTTSRSSSRGSTTFPEEGGLDPTPLPERRFTVMVVPEGGRGEVRQATFNLRQLRGVLLVATVVVLAALFGGAELLRSAWHSRANQRLLDENLALKTQILVMEGTLDEVDQILRRLRLYDAQLEGLPDDFGPIDVEPLPPSATDAAEQWAMGLDTPMEEVAETSADSNPIGVAEAWARDVRARGERTRLALAVLEPTIGEAAERGEDYRSRIAAHPREWPVPGGVLTSTFGYRRSPFTRRWKFHSGVDIAAPSGTPVVAAGTGRVVTVKSNDGYGRMIEIDHGYGIVGRYAHNSRIFVSEGDHVVAGQHIANVGTTGRTTGPHLHYEVDIDGVAVDPLEYLRPRTQTGAPP